MENFTTVWLTICGIYTRYINLFKAYWLRDAPTGLTFNNCTLCPHCIFVFCIYLRTNSDLCHSQHKLAGFYNRDEKCLQRGTDWVFKYSGLRFVCKGFIWEQTAYCATYSINWLVFITEMKSVYCAVRTGSLNKAVCASSVKGLSENKQRLVPLTA